MQAIASAASRLSLFYVGIFLVLGVHLPYWPVWLKSRGLDADEIGLILAATFLVRIAANPLVGHIVDRRGDRRRPLLVLVAGSLAAYALFAAVDGFWGLLAVTVLSAGCYSSLMPITDSLTIMTANERRLDYGRIRLWGSLAFIVSAAAGGQLLGNRIEWILWAILAVHVYALAIAFALPDIETARARRDLPSIRLLLGSPIFTLFLLATGLLQASHMVYYGFATIHWQAAGLSGTVIGTLWAIGVIAEIALFAFSNRVVGWLGPVALLVVAGLGGVVRWVALAVSADPVILAFVQILHAATFGAMHLGAMHFITLAAPAGMSARAQALYSSVTGGVVAGAGMFASGFLYEAFAGNAFLAMATASALGGTLSIILLRRWNGAAIQPKPLSTWRLDEVGQGQ